MTKIYLAVHDADDGMSPCHAFTRREDAEAYEDANDVLVFELHDAPVEKRDWYVMTSTTYYDEPWSWRKDYLGDPDALESRLESHRLYPVRLVVEGWDRDQVIQTYLKLAAEHGLPGGYPAEG
jgi:hypothetical protein